MDLNKSQAQWTNLFREFIQYLRPWRQLRDFRRRFIEGRTRTFEMLDLSGFLSLWTFSGAQRGVNISEDGRLWTTLTDENPAPGSALVEVFMDSAKTLKVASGSAVDGAVVTLAEFANSGLTGTVKLKNPISASDGNIILALDIDEGLKGARAFDAGLAGTYASRKFTDRLNTIASSVNSLVSSMKADIEANFIKTRIKEFMQSPTTSIYSASEAVDINGDAVISRAGLLQELVDAMGDEGSGAGPQTIDQNTVTNGSPDYDPENVGIGVLSVVALRQNAPSGRILISCTSGAETTLEETFNVALTTLDGRTIQGGLSLVIKNEWEGNLIGARLKLVRTITDTNDVGAQVTNYVVNGETLSNTDVGKLYEELVAGVFTGGNRRVNWYSDSAKTLLVARGERTGDGTVTMVEQNASGLSGSCDITYASDDLDIIVNLNPFYADDEIYVDITSDRAGKIQSLMADVWGIPFPQAAAPAKLPDALIEEGAEHILDVS